MYLSARKARSCPDATAGMQPAGVNCASGSPTIRRPVPAGIDADDHAMGPAQAVAALGHCVLSTARMGAWPETGPDPAVTASGHAPAC